MCAPPTHAATPPRPGPVPPVLPDGPAQPHCCVRARGRPWGCARRTGRNLTAVPEPSEDRQVARGSSAATSLLPPGRARTVRLRAKNRAQPHRCPPARSRP
ncbi:hypothetical protein ACFPM0_35275 [Pseudonocardia sulfidoxydans]|uniref:hypothetical protein n=1 Tax=Pseudonocardia sulfidoxydans TaxID=54011 RepID=UPI0036169B32